MKWRSKRPALVSALGLGVAVWLSGPATAEACVLRPPRPPFVVDPALAESDGEPPAALTEVAVSVHRTADTLCHRDGLCTSSSCGGDGTVVLHLERPVGSGASEALGVRIRVVEGSLPPSMEAMTDELHEFAERLAFRTDFDEVTALDAVVTLSAVDRAGNESPPSEPVSLRWSGCTMVSVVEEGCVDESRFDCSDGECMERSASMACAIAAPGGAARSGAAAHVGLLGLSLLLRRRRG